MKFSKIILCISYCAILQFYSCTTCDNYTPPPIDNAMPVPWILIGRKPLEIESKSQIVNPVLIKDSAVFQNFMNDNKASFQGVQMEHYDFNKIDIVAGFDKALTYHYYRFSVWYHSRKNKLILKTETLEAGCGPMDSRNFIILFVIPKTSPKCQLQTE
ncbi:MAG: hypothetical protein JNL57_08580 [Bacteroidetes bacterium]|nr:hypothetical protein [Bacteroidota bacterium]